MDRQRSAAKEKRKERKKARDEARARAGLTKKGTAPDVKVEACVTLHRLTHLIPSRPNLLPVYVMTHILDRE